MENDFTPVNGDSSAVKNDPPPIENDFTPVNGDLSAVKNGLPPMENEMIGLTITIH